MAWLIVPIRWAGSLDSIRENVEKIVIAAVGFALGPLAFSALVRWVALLLSARGVILAVCQSIFHAGPWSVAAVAFFAYQVRGESWAPWFFGGFAASILLMSVAVVPMLLRFRNAQRSEKEARC